MSCLSLSLLSSSFSKVKVTGAPFLFSFSRLLTYANNGCSIASYIPILKYGLKTRTLLRKSIASELEPGYFSARLVFWINWNVSKYSSAFMSVTNDLSASEGVPIT